MGQSPEDESVLQCGTCERIRAAMKEAISNGLPTDELQEEQGAHIQFVIREIQEYLRNAEDAFIELSKFLSLIIGGENQSRSTIPCFVATKKEQRGNGMVVHLE